MTSQLYRRLSALSVLCRYCGVVNACRLPPVIPYDTILMLFRSTSPLGDRASPPVSQRSPSPQALHASRQSLMGHVCCGAFIQCGGDWATDLQEVRYRARANWIGPEPGSVLRSVWSLLLQHITFAPWNFRSFVTFASQERKFQELSLQMSKTIQQFNKWSSINRCSFNIRNSIFREYFDFDYTLILIGVNNTQKCNCADHKPPSSKLMRRQVWWPMSP